MRRGRNQEKLRASQAEFRSQQVNNGDLLVSVRRSLSQPSTDDAPGSLGVILDNSSHSVVRIRIWQLVS